MGLGEFFNGFTPVLDFAKGITGFVEQADPLNMAINVGCDTLGLPDEVKQGLKVAVGFATGDVMLAVDGAVSLGDDLAHNAAACTEVWSPEQHEAQAVGYAGSHAESINPVDREYLKVLETIERRFDDFDRKSMLLFILGPADGKVSTATMGMWELSLDPEMRKVADFFRAHPDYLKRLDKVNGLDGSFDLVAVRSEISAVRSEIDAHAPHGAPPPPGTHAPGKPPPPPGVPGNNNPGTPPPGVGSAPPSGSQDIKDILNDPNLSVEDKVALILQKIMERAEMAELSIAEQLATASENVGKAQDEAQKGGQGGNEKVAKAQTRVAELQRQLQKVVELQSQMFQLLSTLDAKNNEMAKIAIQNLGRA